MVITVEVMVVREVVMVGCNDDGNNDGGGGSKWGGIGGV